jgi:hypothetical protein
MPPTPASIAATPNTRSRVPWNPAVPPPPVTGAAVGLWLVDEVTGVAVSVTVAVAVAVAVWVRVAVEVEVTPGVPDAPLLPEVGVVPEEAGAVPDPLGVVTDTEIVGVVVPDPLQAVTAAGASRVRAPQQRAVSLARNGVPEVLLRTFMDPPHAPGT